MQQTLAVSVRISHEITIRLHHGRDGFGSCVRLKTVLKPKKSKITRSFSPKAKNWEALIARASMLSLSEKEADRRGLPPHFGHTNVQFLGSSQSIILRNRVTRERHKMIARSILNTCTRDLSCIMGRAVACCSSCMTLDSIWDTATNAFRSNALPGKSGCSSKVALSALHRAPWLFTSTQRHVG